jgi:hypothetical protein
MERELIIERTRAGLKTSPVPRTHRGSKASDDRQQGSGGKKAIGQRDATTGGSAKFGRFGSYIISMGSGLHGRKSLR